MHREEVVPLTPDPTPVKLSEDICPIHGFHFVSMPRDVNGENFGYVSKCGLRSCSHGIYKQ